LNFLQEVGGGKERPECAWGRGCDFPLVAAIVEVEKRGGLVGGYGGKQRAS